MAKGAFLARDRISRIGEIYDFIVVCKEKGANKIKLTAECCIKWGTQKRTIREYISLLVEAGKVLDVDGVLIAKKKAA